MKRQTTSDETARLRGQAERVRDSGILGRSATLLRLFDYLVEASVVGRAPKEVEIAAEIFGRGSEGSGEDASVRVYIHRLRRKLEDYDRGAVDNGERLVLPLGEYRFALQPRPESVVSGRAERGRSHALTAALLLLFLTAVAAVGLFLLGGDKGGRTAVRAEPIWKMMATNGRPTLIVLGDYFIYGESDRDGTLDRLVRDFSIDSGAELEEYVMTHPEKAGRVRNVDLTYLPTAAAYALQDVAPLLPPDGDDVLATRMTLSSKMSPAALRSFNIVYIGWMSALRDLEEPLLRGSRFAFGTSYDELVDKRTGRRYTTDVNQRGDGRAHRDVGYIAALNGPAGNRIVIIAGLRDAGVMQAADAASNPAMLRKIHAALGDARSFEALLTVRELRSFNLSGQLVAAVPYDDRNIWNDRTPHVE